MRNVLLSVVIAAAALSVSVTPAFAQAEQHGDFAAGYAFMHETGLSLPLGIAISDGYRVHRNVDIVVETQFEHGTADLIVTNVGVNVWALLGGVRFSGGSRYGDQVRSFGQVLAGVAHVTGTVGSIASATTSGLAIQPGFGVDVPVTKIVAIRPQFDTLLTRTYGSWGKDVRITANVVFRLFR